MREQEITLQEDGNGCDVIIIVSTLIDDGIDMSTRLAVAREHIGWIADEVDKARDTWGYSGAEVTLGDDHLSVFGGGTDWQPIINLQNVRSGNCEAGKYWIGMTVEVAEKLRDLLRSR